MTDTTLRARAAPGAISAKPDAYPSTAASVILAIVGSYIVLKPYYVLPSGLPQIGDLMLIAALPFALLLPDRCHSEFQNRFKFSMLIFCAYAALVNIGWAFALMEPRMAMGATYYAFNLSLMIIVLRIGFLHPKATLLTIASAVTVSAGLQAVSVGLTYDAGRLRQIASFNNPNQLGYWSLLSLCLLWSASLCVRIRWYVQAPAVVCLIYTAAASLSKSALISIAILCLLHFIKTPKLILLGLVALVPVYFLMGDSMLAERVTGRLQGIGEQQDDTLTSRGYVRILQNPEYALVGAGEGAEYRFSDPGIGEHVDVDHEIHSTFGTIVFSYGIIGTIAFAVAVWCLYKMSYRGSFLYLFPPFLYGLTHQGLRFSFLWLLMAAIIVVGSAGLGQRSAEEVRREAKQQRPVTQDRRGGAR